jgi:hypothetical protein
MTNITKKDIFTFCKVLKALSEALESNPEYFQKIIENSKVKFNNDGKNDLSAGHQEKSDSSDLYSLAKELSYEDLLAFLKKSNVDELKGIIKKYNFGYSKLRSVESLSKYIAEQLKKRTTDVFLKHEK